MTSIKEIYKNDQKVKFMVQVDRERTNFEISIFDGNNTRFLMAEDIKEVLSKPKAQEAQQRFLSIMNLYESMGFVVR